MESIVPLSPLPDCLPEPLKGTAGLRDTVTDLSIDVGDMKKYRPGDFRKSRKPVFGSVYQIHGKLSETTFWFCKF